MDSTEENHRKLLTVQPTHQKAIQDLLNRFRWSWTTSVDGLLAGLKRQKSASKYEPGRGVEEEVSAFVDSVGKKKKEASP